MSTLLSATRMVVLHVSRASAMLSGLCFLAIFLVNVVQIGLRTLAAGGLIWVTDLSQLLFIWMIMLGTVAAYHAREHIVVDFLVARLTGQSATIIAAVTRAVEIGLFAFLLHTGLQVTRIRAGIDYIQLGIPTSWGFAAIPAAAVVLLLTSLVLPLRFERQLTQDDID